MKNVTITLLFLILFSNVKAQDYRFGKVSKEELSEKSYELDSTANAVKLYVKKHVYFKYIQDEGFQLVTEVYERIKIYNKEGYNWATKEIKYYTPSGSGSENLNIQEARTYVLENNKIEDYKLKNNEVFTEKNNKFWSADKFTMPNIVDGCIIEWKYKIMSPYKRIDKVVLQSSIPVKKYEATIEIPEYYNYNTKYSGYIQINASKTSKSDYLTVNNSSRDSRTFGGPLSTNHTSQKIDFTKNITTISNENIPALIEEPYVNEITNYAASLQFELSYVQWPQTPIEYFLQTWDDVTKTIYKNDEFGAELDKSGYFKEELEALIVKSRGNKDKLIVEIYEFVKEKVKWNKVNGIFTYNGVKDAYKKGVGNVADINFILIAMLREANIKANPVILSTRDNGISLFPTIDGFNYVIAGIEVENDVILLDATEEYSTPGVLPSRVLNWQGRIVREAGSSAWIELLPKNLSETNVSIEISLKNNGEVEGLKRTQFVNNHALTYRNKFGSNSDDKIIEKIEEDLNLEISEFKISNKTDIYESVSEVYKFHKKNAVDVIGDKIYFKPLLFIATTKNPFKLEKRDYPIDFGMPFGNKEMVSITIPEGYVIESIPESFAIALPNNFGVYRFNISVIDNKINVYSLLKINTAIYPAQNYLELKEFFRLLVNKNVEQVILIKEVS